MLPRIGDEARVAGGASDDPDLVSWARGLGALQEAERLGSPRVGTEHLLLASLLDPVARRLAHDAGIDFRDLQRHIGPPVNTGIGARPGLLPTAEQMHLSDGARQALATLRDGAAGDTVFAGWVRPDRSTDPRARSVLRRRLLAFLLGGDTTGDTTGDTAGDTAGDTVGGAARAALAHLAVEPRTGWLVARLTDPEDPLPR